MSKRKPRLEFFGDDLEELATHVKNGMLEFEEDGSWVVRSRVDSLYDQRGAGEVTVSTSGTEFSDRVNALNFIEELQGNSWPGHWCPARTFKFYV